MILRTLGTFELLTTADGEPEARLFGPQKPLALITYLALAKGRRATRDQLLALLWSDSDPERARKTLRQTLWSIRQRLGDDALQTDDDWITLTLPLSIDCAEFEAAIKQGNLTDAWARYTGAFVPAFAAPGGVGFEQWADLQRDRLRGAWVATGEQLARDHLRNQRSREAVDIARRLRDELPDRQDLWRLLLTALLADGNRMQALVEAEALGAKVSTEGWTLDADVRHLVDRVRGQPTEARGGTATRPQADLIGREAVFAALLAAWQRASAGQGAVSLVRGSAGLGKTRLMQDFQQRLRDIGARVVSVRARPADRDLPFALIASLAEVLGPLPGALGVSPATASALVELAPTLSSLFRRSTPELRTPDELLRVRTLALAELLQATSDERPLAILVDDLHWADEPSRQLLASLAGRISAMPVLVMVCLRPVRGGWSLPPGSTLTDLQPLSAEQLELLASSIASGDPSFLGELGRLLFQMSSGVPLLAVAALELALERRLLRIAGDRWECPDLGQLRQVLMQGSVLEQMLRELPVGGFAMLLGLALAGRPLEEDVLLATADQPAGAPLITALEQRGLLTRSGDGWDISHDRIAESVVSMSSAEQRLDVARRVGAALVERRDLGLRTLRVAGRLLAFAGDPEGERCFGRWLVLSRRRDYWRYPTVAAADFLGEEASPETTRRLAASIPRPVRVLRGFPEVIALLVVVFLLGTGAVLMRNGTTPGGPPAVAIRITSPQSSRGFLWDTTTNWVPVSMDPARRSVSSQLDLVGEDGWPTGNGPDQATVALVDASNASLRLRGTTTHRIVRGRAEFRDLLVEGTGRFRLQFRAGALPPAFTPWLYAASNRPGGPESNAVVRVVSGTISGQPLDSLRSVVEVERGEVIRGTFRFRAVTAAFDAAVLLGAVATWGDRRSNWMVLRALPAHGEVVDTLRLREPITLKEFVAPATPGRYQILLVADTETSMEYIASQTNWMIGAPTWFDGNDLADLSPARVDTLRTRGWLRMPKSFREESSTGPRVVIRDHSLITGAVIDVVVR